MISMEKVGYKIKELRTQQNLTQDNLADKLYVTRQAVSKWEMGQSLPTVDNIIDLMGLFHCDFETILCLKEN